MGYGPSLLDIEGTRSEAIIVAAGKTAKIIPINTYIRRKDLFSSSYCAVEQLQF